MRLKCAYLIVGLLVLETHAVKTARADYVEPLSFVKREAMSPKAPRQSILSSLMPTSQPSSSFTNSSQVSPPMPKVSPSMQPSSQNASEVSSEPIIPPPPAPKVSPSMQPSSLSSPTPTPTLQPTSQPSAGPTPISSSQPTSHPSVVPTVLFASDGIPLERYGHKMVTDSINNLIVVSTLQVSGRVFIYTIGMNNTAYKLISELSSPNKIPTKLDGFASTVDIYNNSLLIGAPDANSVYFYLPDPKTGKFILQQILQPTDITSESNFGCSISIYEDYAIIGANGDSTMSYLEGSAYVYRKSNGLWRLSSKLVPDTYPVYKFGSAVNMKISEGLMTAMVSADNVVYIYRALQEETHVPDVSNVFSGTRYLRGKGTIVDGFYVPYQTSSFNTMKWLLEASYIDSIISDLNDQIQSLIHLKVQYIDVKDLVWELESILYPYEKFGYTNFGYNLHSTGNLSLVSSYARDGSGEVNVYKRKFASEGAVRSNSIKPDLILSASNNRFPGDRFGYSIISRDSDQMIIIGAPDNALNTKNAQGKVYLFENLEIFRNQNVSEKAIEFRGVISNNNSDTRESYGTSLALLGDTLFVSAELGNGDTAFTGVVYPVKNLLQYIFEDKKNEQHDSNSYSKNSHESSATKTVGIIILAFIPVLAISILSLFCINYNKLMCKNVSDVPEYSSACVDDQSIDSKTQLVDLDTALSLDLNIVHNSESVVLRNLKSIPKKLLGLFNDGNIFSPKRTVKDMAIKESEKECINVDEESNNDKVEESQLPVSYKHEELQVEFSPVSGFEDSIVENEDTDASMESSVLLTLKRINIM